jgi:hypothetical protein
MPPWSKDVQYGAAAGFVIIVGIVAIQFGFSAKLVLAILASVGVLFCASLFEGLPRAAMLGAGAVLLLLVAYDLATSCDSACQQTRAEAAQQRATQEQPRLAALRPPTDPLCNWEMHPFTFSPEWKRISDDRCHADLFYDEPDVKLWVKVSGSDTPIGPFKRGQALPDGTVWIMSEGKTFSDRVQFTPAANRQTQAPTQLR